MIDIGVKRFEQDIKVDLGVGSVVDPVRRDRMIGQLGRRRELSILCECPVRVYHRLIVFLLVPEFSFSSLYDRTLKTACPVATSSEVQLVVPVDSINPFEIEPSSSKELKNIEGRDTVVWDTRKGEFSQPANLICHELIPIVVAIGSEALDVRMTWPDENPFRYREPAVIFPDSLTLTTGHLFNTAPTSHVLALPLSARRVLEGYGQERGRIGVEITNNLAREVGIVWVETWPWWIRGFVSSMENLIETNSSRGKLSSLCCLIAFLALQT